MRVLELRRKLEGSAWWEDKNRRIEQLKTRRISPYPDPEPVSDFETGPSTSNLVPRSESGIEAEDHEAIIPMDLSLYRAAKQGNIDDFVSVLEQLVNDKGLLLPAVFDQVSPIGNTYLHVAASFNKEIMAMFIAYHCRPLLTKNNFNGNTALHLTARAGLGTTEILVTLWKNNVDLSSVEEGDETKEDPEKLLLRLRNENGNTALHEALLNSHHLIAHCLINADPEVACYLNNDLESPLYLAAKDGCDVCVSTIFDNSGEFGKMIDRVKAGKSPFHAAISSRKRDILEHMLQKAPELIHLTDGKGRFPLHYAASMGYCEEVQWILDKFPPSANGRDKNGLLPIHWASIKGHVSIIEELLKHSPEPRELLDKEGRSIIHFAAKSGKTDILGYTLKDKRFEGLINMKDKKGNTALHLAASHWRPKTVLALTWDSRVNLTVVNDQGMTAFDAAGSYMDKESPFQQRLTWTALRAGGVPRARPRKIPHVDRETSMAMKTMKSHNYKHRVNILLLVSTLVATITFAAGFTMPGGYNNSNPHQGMATMLEEKKFHVFIFCDTIAMYSSIIVAVSLIWAQLGDIHLVIVALKLALPLLGIALAMMSLAFMAGVSIVVSKLRWLDNAILTMGVVFLAILLVLFFPLCFPLSSNNRLLRYIFYYPFCLLIFVTGGDHDLVEG